MRNRFMRLSLIVSSVLGILAAEGAASAATNSCAEGKCSTGRAPIVLNGKDPLRTSIDTGWMPSCDDPQKEHCNKGIQVRANIALTAVAANEDLFTAALGQSATVEASWPAMGRLELRTASDGMWDSQLTVKHALTPQVELYLDIGPIEQGWTFPATKLLQLLPGSKFNYSAQATAAFNGWAFDKASVTVPAPALQDAQLFSVQLDKLADVIGKITHGTLSLHAQTSPTVSYRTTKVIINGVEIHHDSTTQMAFPPGNFDALDLPATIEGELTAVGDLDVLPAATLENLGDMNFNPPVTITFGGVKVRKHYASEAKKYVFENKMVHIPLPNINKFIHETDGGYVALGTEGHVNAVAHNTGESTLIVRLESSDPARFSVPTQPIEIGPKSQRSLDVVFRPEGLGPASATIKAFTNDPDTPELTFEVKANGTPGVDNDRNGPKDDADGALADGCGCRVVGGERATPSGYAALAGLGLALSLVASRRRKR